eukprot:8828251-Pyramimonas_sp.AAC.1
MAKLVRCAILSSRFALGTGTLDFNAQPPLKQGLQRPQEAPMGPSNRPPKRPRTMLPTGRQTGLQQAPNRALKQACPSTSRAPPDPKRTPI